MGSAARRRITFHSNPKVVSITPATGTAAGGTAITNLAGFDFKVGCKVNFLLASGSEIPATSVVRVNGTQITCVTPGGIPVGVRRFVVRNPDGEVASGSFTFT